MKQPPTQGPAPCAEPDRTEHIGQRPAWDCRACTQPWPCANAKTDLLAEFQEFPSVLMIYMSGQMCEALADLTSHGVPAPPDLYDRFITWARPKLARHYSHHAASGHAGSNHSSSDYSNSGHASSGHASSSGSAPAQAGRRNDRGELGDYSRRGSDSPGAAER